MRGQAGTVPIEFTVRADLIELAQAARRARDVSLSELVTWAVGSYLRSGAEPGPLVVAPRGRLPVRLLPAAIDELTARAASIGVSPRLVVEAALEAALLPRGRVREPTWQPTALRDGTGSTPPG